MLIAQVTDLHLHADAGHPNLGSVFPWRGRQVVTCPSSSSDLGLDFAPMQAAQPDGRPMVGGMLKEKHP